MVRKSLPSPFTAVRPPLVVAAMSGKQGTRIEGVWEGVEPNRRYMVPLLLVDEDLLLNTNYHAAQCAEWVSEFNWRTLGGGAMVFVMVHKADYRFVDGMLQLAERLLDGSDGCYQLALYVTGFATDDTFARGRIAAWHRYDEVSLFTAEQYKRWLDQRQRRLAGDTNSPLGQFQERKVV